MTTIREELFYDVSAINERAVLDRAFRLLGIDPDWPKGSIVVTERRKCPTCDGFGALPYGPGDCPTCPGTGYVPDEWATEERCREWLDEHSEVGCNVHGPLYDANGRRSGAYYGEYEKRIEAETLHAALIAACIAVSEAS